MSTEARNITQVISYSCGVTLLRLMGRRHVRIVLDNGRSIPMDELYARPVVLPEYKEAAVGESAKKVGKNKKGKTHEYSNTKS